MERLRLLNDGIGQVEESIEAKDRNTITSLEAYMAAKERISDARSAAEKALESLNASEEVSSPVLRNLAYANERLNSVNSWAKFFTGKGKKFNLGRESVKRSCQDKISEVEERLQYVEFYLPNSLANVRKELSDAYNDFSSGNFELCLFKASKSKADVDVVLSVFGVEEPNFDALLDKKLKVAEQVLAKEASKGIFPILGYSYYEYANSLRNSSRISSLLYSEYASELGNLDIYFKEENGKAISARKLGIDWKLALVFLLGAAAGMSASLLVRRKEHRKQ
ncbi:hypothetical protein HYT54_01440 [Candidatus Woesearchaeota archaeon]|nr:hypothetical protein [Candidatus Woesearchaeota archaeon]